jgi:hypothetical protein
MVGFTPVSLRGGCLCGRFGLRSEIDVFLFYFCVLATGTKAQTTPSREYIHVGATVIAIEVPTPAVAALTFSPIGGNYSALQTLTVSTATAGATIRYRLDGTTPTETSGTVGTLVGIGSSKTLKAIHPRGSSDETPREKRWL